MWNLFGRYKGRKVLPSARQMNLIAAILNHVTQGTGIKMDMPQLPSTDSPWTIGIDIDWLKAFVGVGATVAPNKLLKTNGDGQIVAMCDALTANQTTDKVLTVEKDGTTVSWVDAGAKNPSTTKTNLTTTANGGEGNAAAQTNTWTFGGTNGVSVTLQTRTYYDHTASTPVLYGYYRTFTFDRNGKLYSISAETRYTIDPPVVGNLTT